MLISYTAVLCTEQELISQQLDLLDDNIFGRSPPGVHEIVWEVREGMAGGKEWSKLSEPITWVSRRGELKWQSFSQWYLNDGL